MGVRLRYYKHHVKSQCFSQGFSQLGRIEKVLFLPQTSCSRELVLQTGLP